MTVSTRLIAVLIFLALLPALVHSAPLPDSAKLLPPDTLLMLTLNDFQQIRTQFEKTRLYELYKDPTMQPFIEKMKSLLDDGPGQVPRRGKVKGWGKAPTLDGLALAARQNVDGSCTPCAAPCTKAVALPDAIGQPPGEEEVRLQLGIQGRMAIVPIDGQSGLMQVEHLDLHGVVVDA